MSVVRFRHTLYSPEDDVRSVIDALPLTAKHSLDCEMFGLTDLAFVANVVTAANRGVLVRVFNDRRQAGGPADKHALQILVDAGAVNGRIQVKVGSSVHGNLDHLKNTIIDGADGALADTSALATGSYNLSNQSQLQDNIFIYTNDPGEVQQALEKFERDWSGNEQRPEWQVQPTHPPIAPSQPASTPESQAAITQAAVPHIAEGAPA
jgi:hypothetical protein